MSDKQVTCNECAAEIDVEGGEEAINGDCLSCAYYEAQANAY